MLLGSAESLPSEGQLAGPGKLHPLRRVLGTSAGYNGWMGAGRLGIGRCLLKSELYALQQSLSEVGGKVAVGAYWKISSHDVVSNAAEGDSSRSRRKAGREHLSESYCDGQPCRRPAQILLAPAVASDSSSAVSVPHT